MLINRYSEYSKNKPGFSGVRNLLSLPKIGRELLGGKVVGHEVIKLSNDGISSKVPAVIVHRKHLSFGRLGGTFDLLYEANPGVYNELATLSYKVKGNGRNKHTYAGEFVNHTHKKDYKGPVFNDATRILGPSVATAAIKHTDGVIKCVAGSFSKVPTVLYLRQGMQPCGFFSKLSFGITDVLNKLKLSKSKYPNWVKLFTPPEAIAKNKAMLEKTPMIDSALI